jgi:hypothetical protein
LSKAGDERRLEPEAFSLLNQVLPGCSEDEIRDAFKDVTREIVADENSLNIADEIPSAESQETTENQEEMDPAMKFYGVLREAGHNDALISEAQKHVGLNIDKG